jgi:hypothetical protein
MTTLEGLLRSPWMATLVHAATLALLAWLVVLHRRQARLLRGQRRELREQARWLRRLAARLEERAEPVAEAQEPPPTPPSRRRPRGRAVPTLISLPDLDDRPVEPDRLAATLAELEEKHGDVWRRGEAGEAADAIARDTGRPVGEVEMVLRLRRQLLDRIASAGRAATSPPRSGAAS